MCTFHSGVDNKSCACETCLCVCVYVCVYINVSVSVCVFVPVWVCVPAEKYLCEFSNSKEDLDMKTCLVKL